MCAIFASYNLNTFKELHQLNKYRGERSYSHYVICPDTKKILSVDKGQGELTDYGDVQGYHIGHIQAPTTDTDNIHPAIADSGYLWHNGILKASAIKSLQQRLDSKEEWDTSLLLSSITELDDIDGSFGCLHLVESEKVSVFRNDIIPMFMDKDFNISSTKFSGGQMITSGVIQELDFNTNTVIQRGTFATNNNPYFFQ